MRTNRKNKPKFCENYYLQQSSFRICRHRSTLITAAIRTDDPQKLLSTSAVAAFACGASLTAHAAGSTDENSLNFITDIFKDSPQPGEIEDATAITAEKNAEWYESWIFRRREFANAERGWLDNAEGKIIYAEDGKFAWDLQSYGDLNRDAPDTVNPSLWRNTQLNAKAGLFEVCDGIYQVRGFDMANATFIRTNNGWIILMS